MCYPSLEILEMSRRRDKFFLSDMSAEEIDELMEAVESDTYTDNDSDDSIGDPNYIPDEIEAEMNEGVNAAIYEMNAGETGDSFLPSTFNFTLNETAATASSTLNDLPIIIENDDVEVCTQSKEATTMAAAEATTSTAVAATTSTAVAATTSKNKKKRARSPLPSIEAEGPSFTPDDGGLIGPAKEIEKKFERILWCKKSLQYHVNQVAFRGDSCLPDEIKSLGTPFQLFRYFFNDNVIQIIVEETNRAAVGERFSVNANDILQYVGILLYMSVYKYPNLESYWGKNAFVPIQRTMPWKRFYAIKRYLCFQNESERRRKGEPGYDPLFRIRNLANELCKTFDSIPKTARLCVDEQMCSTKAKHHLRQYMPAKPHKWGVKFFVLCDSNGFAYRFEIYNGAGDNVLLPNTPDLGATANVVVRLSQSVPDFKNHIIYFDNFYTSIPLLVYLRSRGIYSLGTVRSNRITDCKLPTESEVKNKPRGYSIEYMANVRGIDVNAVLWKDNKCVRLLSTYVGIEPFARTFSADQQRAKASRYDRSNKSFIDIDCPQDAYDSYYDRARFDDSHDLFERRYNMGGRGGAGGRDFLPPPPIPPRRDPLPPLPPSMGMRGGPMRDSYSRGSSDYSMFSRRSPPSSSMRGSGMRDFSSSSRRYAPY